MHVLLGLKGPGSVALSRVTSSMTPADILATAAQTPGPTVVLAAHRDRVEGITRQDGP